MDKVVRSASRTGDQPPDEALHRALVRLFTRAGQRGAGEALPARPQSRGRRAMAPSSGREFAAAAPPGHSGFPCARIGRWPRAPGVTEAYRARLCRNGNRVEFVLRPESATPLSRGTYPSRRSPGWRRGLQANRRRQIAGRLSEGRGEPRSNRGAIAGQVSRPSTPNSTAVFT